MGLPGDTNRLKIASLGRFIYRYLPGWVEAWVLENMKENWSVLLEDNVTHSEVSVQLFNLKSEACDVEDVVFKKVSQSIPP